jgi:phage tail sheath protein FI
MATYKTPGVYVEEISTLPPSVAEVSTAIPAFLGYTEKGPTIARINTLLEYESLFGRAKPGKFAVTAAVNAETGLKEVRSVRRELAAQEVEMLLYYSISLYFKNGGGSCYVVSVGNYNDSPSKAHFEAGLARLEQEDEPTLIVLTDAVGLPSADYYDLCQQSLAQCQKLKDRFAILDVLEGDGVAKFRDGIGMVGLMYGAAYYPYLRTSLTFQYVESDVTIEGLAGAAAGPTWRRAFGTGNGIVVTYAGNEGDAPKVRIVAGTASDAVGFSVAAQVLTISDAGGKKGSDVAAAWETWKATGTPGGFGLSADGDGSENVPHTNNANVDLTRQASAQAAATTLGSIRSSETALYSQIKTALGQQWAVLPPSGALAGVYARVDRERGVWKAPANVGLLSVTGPVVKITHEQQEDLNVDPDAGKSINALRAFTGKGTLAWGARTLAGNDNEWRYIPVRRLFNLIEESTRKSTAFAVFEPNDATTWLKVKAMIESYLYGLWERGALAGSTPEASYFVNVGLGKTMTAQDILEGRMIVEIGVAAVRPAEFIILRFSHQMQQA